MADMNVVWEKIKDVRCVRAVAIPEADGGWSVISTNLPGCCTQGETLDECKNNLREAAEAIIEVCHETGKSIPWGTVDVRRCSELAVCIRSEPPAREDGE